MVSTDAGVVVLCVLFGLVVGGTPAGARKGSSANKMLPEVRLLSTLPEIVVAYYYYSQESVIVAAISSRESTTIILIPKDIVVCWVHDSDTKAQESTRKASGLTIVILVHDFEVVSS